MVRSARKVSVRVVNQCLRFRRLREALMNRLAKIHAHFIEIVDNPKRLHSSLGYRTPDEVDAEYDQAQSTLAITETVSMEG